MKNKLQLGILLCNILILLQSTSFSQHTDTIYYDQKWNEILDHSKADYFRIIATDSVGTPVGLVRDYYSSGIKQWEGELLSLNPEIKNGYCTWYTNDGTISEINYFRKGMSLAELIDQKKLLNSEISPEQILNYCVDSLSIPNVDETKAWITNSIALYLYSQKKYRDAMKYLNVSAKLFYSSKEYTQYIIALKNNAQISMAIGNYKSADSLYQQVLETQNKVLDKYSPDIAESYLDQAFINKKLEKYSEAENYYKEALKIIIKAYGKDSLEYINTLNDLALLYFFTEKNKEAEPLFFEVLEGRRKIFGENNLYFATSLNNLALLYMTLQNYEMSETFFKQALEIFKRVSGESSKDYINSLNSFGRLNVKMEKYVVAESIFLNVLQTRRKNLGENNVVCGYSLQNLAEVYEPLGKFKEAENALQQASEIFIGTLGETHSDYINCIEMLATLYLNMGNFMNAEHWYQKVLELRQKWFGEDLWYAESMSKMASLYKRMGVYSSAEPLYKQVLETRTRILGLTHPDIAASLNNLGLIEEKLGNYKEAEDYYKKAVEIIENHSGKDNLTYSTMISNLALLYQDDERYTEAEQLFKQAMKIRMELFGEENQDYAKSLSYLGVLYFIMGKYEKAGQIETKALKINKLVNGENSLIYANGLFNLAATYYYLKQDSLAEVLLENVVRIKKETLGESNPIYLNSLIELAFLYETVGSKDLAAKNFREANDIQNQNLLDNFSFLSDVEKEKYVGLIKHNYDIINSYLTSTKDTSFSFFNEQYNNVLIHKGMILASWSALQQSIKLSGDTTVINKYENLRNLKQRINLLIQQPITERKTELNELIRQAEQEEKKLMRISKHYKQINEEFSLKTKNVQVSLNPNDAAIEIFNFDYLRGEKCTDSTLYYALVLRKSYEFPKLVYLCEERQLNRLLPIPSAGEDGINFVYSSQADDRTVHSLYQLIWKPLEPYLQGITTINYAVSGQLNKVPFHALIDTTDNLLLNKYNLVQFSSTREVALPKPDKKLESIAILGGIDYDSDTTDMLALAREVSSENLTRSVFQSGSTCRNMSLRYLPGTMEEAREISDECQAKGIGVNLYSGKQATEEQFRHLGEKKSPSIIHVATHGFYFPEEKVKDREVRMKYMQIEQENQFVYSPDPLIRSGLVLAGANHVWKGEKLPKGVDDGILTARDVSQLNLLNTELIVLSACQTGLGDVKGSEGVYGLQRAFKMAGARYIMMSLWKVPDESTKEFMVSFYGNLSSGMTIRDSYRNTQKEMSNKYPDDPYKWAAFVLVE